MSKVFSIRNFIIIVFVCLAANGVSAQTDMINYQGRLADASGNPANGNFQFQFRLFDAAVGGTQISSTITNVNITVTSGFYNARLDFGANAFPGADRFLEIAVRTTIFQPYYTLPSRDQIVSAPYSIKSKMADTATNTVQLGGVDAARFVQRDAGGNVSIAGGLTVNGSLSLNTVNAATQYNLGGQRILGIGIGAGGNGSFFAGLGAGQLNTGANNTFVGHSAGQRNTTGDANAFFGNTAGFKNTTGGSNSFFGAGAGVNNVNGSSNAFFGTLTGSNNTKLEAIYKTKSVFVNCRQLQLAESETQHKQGFSQNTDKNQIRLALAQSDCGIYYSKHISRNRLVSEKFRLKAGLRT